MSTFLIRSATSKKIVIHLCSQGWVDPFQTESHFKILEVLHVTITKFTMTTCNQQWLADSSADHSSPLSWSKDLSSGSETSGRLVSVSPPWAAEPITMKLALENELINYGVLTSQALMTLYHVMRLQ